MRTEGRIAEARQLLSDLDFDKPRKNKRSALVLLSLLNLDSTTAWSNATNPLIGTRAMMDWMEEKFDTSYKPNSRETIRRSTLHQFVEAFAVRENPDDPTRPKNSKDWCYQIHPRLLGVARSFGTDHYDLELRAYLAEIPGLRATYRRERELARIPATLPDGRSVSLSPGGQSTLIHSILEEFCPLHTPGSEVLYIGDTGEKFGIFEEERLAQLGISLDQHGKMPDLIVYYPSKNWLVLLEAASSHGPVDASRRGELAQVFANSTAGLVYVSCFPSRLEMRRYLADIAWETEVWCSDNATHLIHFNGSRFLGPYKT